jgi:hypothetical protein
MEALRDLTGAPYFVMRFDTDKEEDIWNKIQEGQAKDWCMAAYGEKEGPGSEGEIGTTGLFNLHAYSLIDSYEVTDAEGN